MDENLPARSSFKTYSPDIWKRDQVHSVTYPSSLHIQIHFM